MALKLRISSSSLDKFLKSQKNLAKPPPALFPDDPKSSPPQPNTTASHNTTVDSAHPILRKLEHSCKNIKQFHQIHAQLIVHSLFHHPYAASRYVKKLCTSLNSVSHCIYLYDHIEKPDAFMCNSIMRSLVNKQNDPYGGLRFYDEKMVGKWVWPNHYTFPLVAKACAGTGNLRGGQKVHALAVKFGYEMDLFVRNSLMRMYCVCGGVLDARVMFDGGFVLDLVSWNTMIDGYVKNGEVGLARELFDEMSERDVFSWNSMICGYAAVGDMETAEWLFEKMPCRDIVSWNSMIEGYSKMKNFSMARAYFDQMPCRDAVSWNIVLALYLSCRDYGECLRLFDKMVEGGEARPNQECLVSVLTACAKFRRFDQGKWIHSYIKESGMKPDVLLWIALLTMYAKCGRMDLARDVFDEIPKKNVISWNSMIMGYGIHGQGEKALEMFLEMEKRGPMPNDTTLLCLLSACHHAGMLLEGWWYFDLMNGKYKIKPKEEHYGCVVDLLSHAGLTELSEELMRKICMDIEPTLWEALHLKIGVLVAKRLIELYPKDMAPYLLLSRIYAAERNWDEVENLRMIMKENGLERILSSTVDHPGDGSLHRRNMVLSMLKDLDAQMELYYTDHDSV